MKPAPAIAVMVFIGIAFTLWIVAVNAAEPLNPDGYALTDCGGAIDRTSGVPLVCCRVVWEDAI